MKTKLNNGKKELIKLELEITDILINYANEMIRDQRIDYIRLSRHSTGKGTRHNQRSKKKHSPRLIEV